MRVPWWGVVTACLAGVGWALIAILVRGSRERAWLSLIAPVASAVGLVGLASWPAGPGSGLIGVALVGGLLGTAAVRRCRGGLARLSVAVAVLLLLGIFVGLAVTSHGAWDLATMAQLGATGALFAALFGTRRAHEGDAFGTLLRAAVALTVLAALASGLAARRASPAPLMFNVEFCARSALSLVVAVAALEEQSAAAGSRRPFAAVAVALVVALLALLGPAWGNR